MKMKEIKGFSGYFVSEEGVIFSDKSGLLKEVKQWADSRDRYMIVGMKRDDGVQKRMLVHRLVAEAYIENPRKLSDVNHIDKNPKNNHVSNLEWLSHIDNLHKSYETRGPVRNFKNCVVFKGNVKVKECQSVEAAARWAAKEYNLGYSSLVKHRKAGDVFISTEDNPTDFKPKQTRNRNPIVVYYKGVEIGCFNTKELALAFLKKNYPFDEFPLSTLSGIHPPAKYKNFEFVRQKRND